MDIQLKETSSYAREANIDLSWEEIAADFEQAIKQFSKRVKLPGFRPGKVPRKVLMKQFQPAIEADFVENSVNTYYLKALQEKNDALNAKLEALVVSITDSEANVEQLSEKLESARADAEQEQSEATDIINRKDEELKELNKSLSDTNTCLLYTSDAADE